MLGISSSIEGVWIGAIYSPAYLHNFLVKNAKDNNDLQELAAKMAYLSDQLQYHLDLFFSKFQFVNELGNLSKISSPYDMYNLFNVITDIARNSNKQFFDDRYYQQMLEYPVSNFNNVNRFILLDGEIAVFVTGDVRGDLCDAGITVVCIGCVFTDVGGPRLLGGATGSGTFDKIGAVSPGAVSLGGGLGNGIGGRLCGIGNGIGLGAVSLGGGLGNGIGGRVGGIGNGIGLGAGVGLCGFGKVSAVCKLSVINFSGSCVNALQLYSSLAAFL